MPTPCDPQIRPVADRSMGTRTRRSLRMAIAVLWLTHLNPLQAQAPAPAPAPGATAPAAAPTAVWGAGSQRFSLATGSPGELGLLETLAKRFAERNDVTIEWFRAGSGAAMKLLQERKVDMALAHAPAAERKAVADGWATGRRLFGSNEFWIVGPATDPAEVAAAGSVVEAMKRIHARQAPFVSRGDNSGTHQKENELWKAAGIAPPTQPQPWYIITRDFMAASLARAHQEQAYFLTDSSTFIAERSKVPNLKVLARGDALLANPYHTLYLSEPTAGAAMARRFGEFLLSEDGQAILRGYGRERYGEAMYNDAQTTARMPGVN